MEEKNTIKEVKKEFGDGFVFRTNHHFSIQISQKALSLYSENLESALNFENDIPIFLDTNVLLDYYKISFTERDDIIKFFDENKSRIYITNQIEKEFLKHRIDHIRSYLNSVDEFVNAYKNIKSEIEKLKSGEIKGFNHYTKENPILVNDHSELCSELTDLNKEISTALEKIFEENNFEKRISEKEEQINEIRKKLEGKADIERDDPLLKIVTQFNIIDNLSEEEITFLKKQYDELYKEFEPLKADHNSNWKYTFPGCGDKKDDPYGDFIIYHEMIKFQCNSTKDAIFLTNDTTKNDWLLRNKVELKPYTHYIINSYSLSGHTLYIFNAKDKIRVSYNPIYTGLEDDKNELTQNEVQLLSTINEQREESNSPQLKFTNQKIDLNQFRNKPYINYYENITKEEFIAELEESEKWAIRYGSGFVGTNSFIMKYLGAKGYHYRHSYDIKDDLVRDSLVEEYIYEPENPEYNSVDALRIKNKA